MSTMSESRSIRVILFSDVVDSSGLMFSDETTTIQLIERDLAAFSEGINRWGGELIKNTGDGILAIFSTSSQALDFIQEFLVHQQQQQGPILQHRFGLHIGEIYLKNSDVIGQGVHLAARLQTISPVNGVAFTHGTHANIDPRFRNLASQLGSIRLKGIPEDIICYGIGEDEFLGRDATTVADTRSASQGEARADNLDSTDSQAIARFIHEQQQLIIEQPIKAAAALSDYAQERSHLLVGARDILTRPEWSKILGTTSQSNAELNLTRGRLSSWIHSSFSLQTAKPWIDAIGGPVPTSASSSDSTAAPPAQEPSQRGRLPLILASAVALTVILITAALLLNKLRPAPAVPGGNGVSSGSSRQIDIDQGNGENASGSQALSPPPLPESVSEAIGADSLQADSAETGNSSSSEEPQTSQPSGGTGAAGWKRIESALEDGLISTTDLTLADALGALDHWVQSFSERGPSVVIRLRTRQPASPAACEQVLASYQRTYKVSPAIKPWVILESSRADGKDSAAGFLPVCQLSPQGLLTTGRL